jgi:hypothetical protein
MRLLLEKAERITHELSKWCQERHLIHELSDQL